MPWLAGLYRKWNYSSSGWTGDAANLIGIEAGRHDSQDDDFATGINDCLNKNGQNQATANINLGSNKIYNLANGTVSTDAATYGQLTSSVSAAMPVGSITMYGSNTPPTGYFICNGQPLSRSTYAALFAVISTTYGAGDGFSTFNVPDLQQRFPLGKAASGTGATLGGSGGAIDHTHTVAGHSHSMSGAGATLATGTESANHTHALGYGTNLVAGAVAKPGSFSGTSTADTSGQSANHTHALSGSIGNVSGGVSGDSSITTSTSNPPFMVVNFIIKA